MHSLAELAPLLNVRLVGANLFFERVSIDSRRLQKDDLFIALRGDHFDGHQFIDQAIASGAIAVVVDVEQMNLAVPQLVVVDTCLALGQISAHKRSLFNGTVIGVTGSSGKTSVKGMLREIISINHEVVVTPGNFNNQIGVPLSLMSLASQSHAVIELGTNHPGEINYLTGLVLPDIALVNNVMPAHIGGFGSLAAIAEEKGAIYSRLNPLQTAIINLDDPFRSVFEAKTSHCRRIGFTVANASANYPVLKAQNIAPDGNFGFSFELIFNDQATSIRLQVPGLHNVKNALAAASCAFSAGCSFAQIAAGLGQFSGEKSRMQRKIGLNHACVIDDTYNANPGSVMAAIDFLSSCIGKRILVLGDLGELGDLTEQAHQELGAYAKQKQLDAVYVCGKNAQKTLQGTGHIGFAFESKQALANALAQVLDAATTVLIKGSRSARMEDVVNVICPSEALIKC